MGLQGSVRNNVVECNSVPDTYAALKLIKVEHLGEVLHSFVHHHVLVQGERLDPSS